jgi:hypothetical protein
MLQDNVGQDWYECGRWAGYVEPRAPESSCRESREDRGVEAGRRRDSDGHRQGDCKWKRHDPDDQTRSRIRGYFAAAWD